MLVHGEEAVEIHQPLPTEGRISSVTTVTGIYDKGSGAVVAMETKATDLTTGEPMFTIGMSAFIRGEGGFGGDRGPSGKSVPPDRDPDHRVSYRTRTDQALLYRLNGDRNPLHSDPTFAARGGFDKPILHGLCTYGFTGRALLHQLCGSDPDRFLSMYGRLPRPTFPGDVHPRRHRFGVVEPEEPAEPEGPGRRYATAVDLLHVPARDLDEHQLRGLPRADGPGQRLVEPARDSVAGLRGPREDEPVASPDRQSFSTLLLGGLG